MKTKGNINKYKIAPLQAEAGEYFVTPDFNIVKSLATKKHRQMKDDEITDYLPDNSYVFSNDPKMRLNKKDFENLTYAKAYINYQEGLNNSKPKDPVFSEFFNKKSNTPAELIKNISKKIPVLSEPVHYDNPFIQRANQFNTETRKVPIILTMLLNESKKEQSSPKNEMTEQDVNESVNTNPNNQQVMDYNQALQKYQYGGRTRFYGNVNNGSGWGDFGKGFLSGGSKGVMLSSFIPVVGPIGGFVIGGLLEGIGNIFSGNSARKKAKENEEKRLKFIDELYKKNDESYGVNNAFTLAKGALPLPKYNYLDLSDNIDRSKNTYDQLLKTENARRNAASANAYAGLNSNIRNLSALGLTPSQYANVLGNMSANTIQAANQANTNYDSYYDQLRVQRTNTLNAYDEALAKDRQYGQNLMEGRRYDRNMNVVGELQNNYSKFNEQELRNLNTDYYTMLALQNASSQDYQNALAQNEMLFSKVTDNLVNAYNIKENMDVIKSYKDALKSHSNSLEKRDSSLEKKESSLEKRDSRQTNIKPLPLPLKPFKINPTIPKPNSNLNKIQEFSNDVGTEDLLPADAFRPNELYLTEDGYYYHPLNGGVYKYDPVRNTYIRVR